MLIFRTKDRFTCKCKFGGKVASLDYVNVYVCICVYNTYFDTFILKCILTIIILLAIILHLASQKKIVG